MKVKILFTTFCVFLSIILFSCIDPFFIETDENELILNVDGFLSTETKSHLIDLTYASQYSDVSLGTRIPAKGASVIVEDQNGKETVFEEEYLEDYWYCFGGIIPPNQPAWRLLNGSNSQSSGILTARYYSPKDFSAKVGYSYRVKIETREGKKFESTFQVALPVVNLDSIEFIPFNEATINPLIERKGLNIVVSFKDPDELGDFYLWKSSNTFFELNTEPDKYVLSRNSNCPFCAFPLDCCYTCYIPDVDIEASFGLNTDKLFNGLTTGQLAFQITDDGLKFKSRYKLKVDQYAISEETYKYYNLVQQQLSITGSVFDPLPANLRGNLKELGNSDNQVLGFFTVASVSSKTLYINRDDIPTAFLAPRKILPMDCKDWCGKLRLPPSTTPPSDWKFTGS